MSEKIKYIGPWEKACLCAECGEYFGKERYVMNGRPCPNCGAIGLYWPETVETSRRFVCTKKRWFRSDLGYYEWSGELMTELGGKLDDRFLARWHRRPASKIPMIAAAGLASGLF